MTRVRFEVQSQVPDSNPLRTDIALFVGFAARPVDLDPTSDRRFGGVPRGVRDWLANRGWNLDLDGPSAADRQLGEWLHDVPIPVTSWDVFDRLFAWGERDYGGGIVGTSYLGAAVRSFFTQGGKRCYVVAVGDTQPPPDTPEQRLERLRALIPGYPSTPRSPADRAQWSGVWHLFDLPDVSFVCLPDLCDAVRTVTPVTQPAVAVPDVPEAFRECSVDEVLAPDRRAARLEAPRSDEEGFDLWADALDMLVRLVRTYRKDAQVVASVPIPVPGDAEPVRLRAVSDAVVSAGSPRPLHPALSSAFLQLAYPWLRTPGSDLLPQQLESPDGVLTGILARNALERGTFRSAADLHTADVYDTFPRLSQSELESSLAESRSLTDASLVDRVSLVGRTPSGLRLLSDVSRSLDARYRPASVSRLVAMIIRAAQRAGESATFEPSGEALWGEVRRQLEGLMQGLWEAGALTGRPARRAYDVRCDRSTMTQNDIDNGRLIATVRFDAAVPIERITVVLAISEGGGVSIIPGVESAQEAA